MQIVTCDVCRKKIDESATDSLFFYYAEYGVCEECKDNLEYQIKGIIRENDPFAYEWYNKLLQDSLGKSVQKGKK
jgi:hypothetical protein